MQNTNDNFLYLLFNVPSYTLNPAPNIGIPQLLGILKEKNINFEYVDLNLKYFNYLLSQKGINELISQTESLSDKRKIKLLKDIQKNTEFYFFVLKSKKLFYNPLLSSICDKKMSDLYNICAYIPRKFLSDLIPDINNYRTSCENEEFNINTEKLISYFEGRYKHLSNFYESIINISLSKTPDLIGISINTPDQLLTGLQLCYLIKKKRNVHINIGGFFFTHFYKVIKNLPDLFNVFFDSVSIDDNNSTIFELPEYLQGKISLNSVGNIIYLDNDKLIINPAKDKIKFNQLPFQSFIGFEKDDYLIPEFVLPIQASKSCYWRKCIFCSCNETKYELKSVNRIIDEIEYLTQTYKTKYFCFWDNALHPKYLSKLAEILINRKLNISYSIFARFENDFDIDLLKKLQKSGCCNINWGLDSADEKILKVVNKGINPEIAQRILKDAYNAGIYNSVFLILGHPSETISNLDNDVSFIKRNKKYIGKLNLNPSVWFINGSIIYKDKDKYKKQITLSDKEKMHYYKKICKINNYDNQNILSMSVNIILYMSKKGLKASKKDLFLLNIFNNNLLAKIYFYICRCLYKYLIKRK